jgi:hypothetical protein
MSYETSFAQPEKYNGKEHATGIEGAWDRHGDERIRSIVLAEVVFRAPPVLWL